MALARNAKIDAIATVPLFAHCTRRELAKIAALADEIDLPAGRTIIREGDRGREFFVLLEGEAEVRKGNRKVATRRAGEFVGEIALVSDVPRTGTVTTIAPTRALVMTDRAFRALLREAPDIQAKVLRALADRLPDVI